MKIEIEREKDGRWIAEAPDLSGVMAYGKTRKQATAKAEALALRASTSAGTWALGHKNLYSHKMRCTLFP